PGLPFCHCDDPAIFLEFDALIQFPFTNSANGASFRGRPLPNRAGEGALGLRYFLRFNNACCRAGISSSLSTLSTCHAPAGGLRSGCSILIKIFSHSASPVMPRSTSVFARSWGLRTQIALP